MRLAHLRGRLPALALVLSAGVVAVYAAARAGGLLAAVLATASVACAVALLFRGELAAVDAPSAEWAFDGVLLALPGVLTVYFGLNAGGYFPDTQAFVAIGLAVVLLLRVTLARVPFAGFSRPLAVSVGALSLYALWILLSATWSDAPARALLEFDRALVYLLALVLFGSVPRTSERLRWVLRSVACGIVVVAIVGLATRVLPDVFPIAPNLGPSRLSYPLTYSNAMGILGVLGALLCVHIAASLHEPVGARALASAALPILGATVFFTSARGAVGAGAIGLAAYVVLGRPRGLVPALIAAAPATILAVVKAGDANLLATPNPTTATAAEQGHEVAVAVALCALGAGALRLLLAPLDERLTLFSLTRRLRPEAKRSAWAVSIVVAAIVLVGAGAPGWLSRNYDRLVHTGDGNAYQGGSGRIDDWKIAIRGFREQELHGQGAGTYELTWNRQRSASFTGDVVLDAHSLYVEVLSELGVVGFILLVTAMAAILASVAPVSRGPNRSLYAALFAAALAWAVHAGVDWDWEIPAVTVWLFAVGGAALAAQRGAPGEGEPTRGARIALGVLLLVTAVAPGLVLASQRQLDDSVDAFYRGDCSRTIERASASISTLEVRPEPYEAIAYCQARSGQSELAVQAMENAVERDPSKWEFRYGLALVRGAAGLDALPAARAAQRLNPHHSFPKELIRELRGATPRERKRLTTALAREQFLTVVR